jgi:hypothetical protein
LSIGQHLIHSRPVDETPLGSHFYESPKTGFAASTLAFPAFKNLLFPKFVIDRLGIFDCGLGLWRSDPREWFRLDAKLAP